MSRLPSLLRGPRRWRFLAVLSVAAFAVAAWVAPLGHRLLASPDGPGGADFGDPLPGLTTEQLAVFEQGKEDFEDVEGPEDGVGPVFNGSSCAECHAGPATGGGSARFATYFGRRVSGRFDPMIDFGGPNIQAQGIIGLNGFQFQGEVVPRQATIVARRRAGATFGFGLVDAVTDDALRTLAMMQSRSTPFTAGRPNEVTNLRNGRRAVGRFGWKAQGGTLLDFAAGAYKDELGVTTAGFVRDGQGRNIGEENAPQGRVDLLRFNPVASPNEADQEDVESLANFMRLLAPPPRGPVGFAEQRGERVFAAIGCNNCHVPSLTTGASPIRALSRVTFNPYSDFLLHDMGRLGDGIEQGSARGTEMRTAPLWGLRTQPSFLHDGRASSIADAILMHEGQGAGSQQQFRRLSAQQRRDLLAFLNSL